MASKPIKKYSLFTFFFRYSSVIFPIKIRIISRHRQILFNTCNHSSLYLALRTGSLYAFVENIWKFVRAQPTISKIFEIHQTGTNVLTVC
ncbi:unnamed protein product [Acanthoscelides obtectus]|uniref:Uncharacterized protein n=1 Tax=Acanthoscelides obtectus TaxID=200917 RepID=A0A9P0LP43_ACAOB|nr:unnamed protein product [Acanthoscelides obtectus]CAK1632723.1 hypothetical protein AOBTE_LOCUS7695 [Acanthoscelides obtectus]